MTTGKISQDSIVILSPYNAQVSEIKDELKKKKMDQITVTTITKSQGEGMNVLYPQSFSLNYCKVLVHHLTYIFLLGSEWRYVIISTVCSLPSEESEALEPDRAWLSKHLGFVGDPNQINVAITRAKEGLCIIGEILLFLFLPVDAYSSNFIYSFSTQMFLFSKETKSCSSAIELGKSFWTTTVFTMQWQMQRRFQCVVLDNQWLSNLRESILFMKICRNHLWLHHIQ